MSNKAKAILWIGLILIATQIGQLWPTVRKYIFSPGPGTIPLPGSQSGGSGLPGRGLVPLPGFGQNPFFPGWPFVTSTQVPAKHRVK